MNRLLKVLLAPLLVLALFSSTVYVGMLRPGATKHLVATITETDAVRAQVARAFVDVIIEDEPGLIGALITTNREQVDAIVAETFADPKQREQLGIAAQKWVDAMLNGEPVVSLDPRPLYRPIYAALQDLLPLLDFTEKDLNALDPIILGVDEPLPDLRVVRNIAIVGTALWLLWLLLAAILIRRVGRRGWKTVGIQMSTIGAVALAIVIAAPRLLASMAGDATAQALARTALVEITSVGLWLTLVVTVVGAAAWVYGNRSDSGEGVLTSEGTTDTQ